jgi:uncharacterized DUF497 family protein
MVYEWDEKKAATNLSKHGVFFEEAKTVFEALIILSSKPAIPGRASLPLPARQVGETLAFQVGQTMTKAQIRLSAKSLQVSARRLDCGHERVPTHPLA